MNISINAEDSLNGLNSQSELLVIINLLCEYFGSDLDAIAYFGSTVTGNDNLYSDIDFIVLLKGSLSQSEREIHSPRIKKISVERGVKTLSAFNIYNTTDFLASPDWFKVIVTTDMVVLQDKSKFFSFLGNLSHYKKSNEKSKTWWVSNNTEISGISNRALELSNKLKNRASMLSISKELSDYYYLESERLMLMGELMKKGVFTTEGTISWARKILKGKGITKLSDRKKDFQHHELKEKLFFSYGNIGIHAEAYKILRGNDDIGAIVHLLCICHSIMRQILHLDDIFVIDGEITQLFFRNFRQKFTTEEGEFILNIVIKSEQIVGRSGVLTFDIDSDGLVYAESEKNLTLLHGELITVYKLIKARCHLEDDQVFPTISLIIPSFNRFDELKACLQQFKNVVFPINGMEIIVVDDGSLPKYDDEKILQINQPFHLRIIHKKHSGVTDTRNEGIEAANGKYIVFLDDDIRLFPLTLLRLIGKGSKSGIGITGVTTLGLPESGFIQEYINHRGLLSGPIRDKKGIIVNVPTCCAFIKKSILDTVGNFSTEQSKEGITFGGEDVDLSYRLSNSGLELAHESKATVYHRHRTTLKALIKQHIGYGEGTAFHCLERGRKFEELGIPEPTYYSTTLSTIQYLLIEVPKRVKFGIDEGLSAREIIGYPILDLIRKTAYNIGVMKVASVKSKFKR